MELEKNDIDKHVGNRVRQQRIILGVSQATLGDYLNVSFQQIQKYEKGRNRIAAGTLYRIAKYLNVDVSCFYEGLHSAGSSLEPEATIDRIDLELAGKINAIKDTDLKKNIMKLVKSFADSAGSS